MTPTVAICIATHNRLADLTRTLAELERLDPKPDEILVAADGCQDGTLEMLRAAGPRWRLIVHEQARGSIPSRNELAAASQSDVFLSIDDDSYPIEADFIARVRALFAAEPRLAVVTFPQRTDEFPESMQCTDFGPARFVGSYVNSGAAIRRSAFEALGGYPGFFFHAYEEPDFALRCVCAGWQVRFEPGLTIRHHFSNTQRSQWRTHQRHARNEFWSVLLRCPAPQIIAVALFRIARQFGYAWKRGLSWVVREPQWWLAALRGIPQCLTQRRPIPWQGYRMWMELVRHPIESQAEWDARFAHLRF
jgi:GT2 family glycosyltransferase